MIEAIKARLREPAYDFLRTDAHLGRNILFLTLGGSLGYGTNVEDSDLDLRGCVRNTREELLGLASFEQFLDRETDTVLYSFRKLVGLLLDCNPGAIELLGCRPEHYLVRTPAGDRLLANSSLFLSKRAAASFGGYAGQQLRRLENALARDRYPQAEKERRILTSCMSAMRSFSDQYCRENGEYFRLYTGPSQREELESEIFADICLRHIPLRDYQETWSRLQKILKSFEQLGKRNRKKDDRHLNKHAMHLIRLYLMCLDILERQEIVTYREKEQALLLSIRQGAYQQPDGGFRPEFYEMVDAYDGRLAYAREHTALPERPDMKEIEQLVLSINEEALCDEY